MVTRDDLLHVIVRALMDSRYVQPRRRRNAWYEAYDEDLVQARRCAAAIVDALEAAGLQWTAPPPSRAPTTPGPRSSE